VIACNIEVASYVHTGFSMAGKCTANSAYKLQGRFKIRKLSIEFCCGWKIYKCGCEQADKNIATINILKDYIVWLRSYLIEE